MRSWPEQLYREAGSNTHADKVGSRWDYIRKPVPLVIIKGGLPMNE
jgi:hypothetical protein